MVKGVKEMLISKAREDYLKKVEERIKQEKQLEAEVEKMKQEGAKSKENDK